MPKTASPSVLESASRSVQAHKRIRGIISKTPVIASRCVFDDGTQLLFKAEHFQHTGSFKFRGATAKLTLQATDTPVVTASSGNHGIACSRAAQTTGHKLTVVLPENVAKAKLDTVKSYGTEVVLHGAESGEAETRAAEIASHGEHVFVSPYNDLDVISGQGTIGLELLEQLEHIDNIFISMGGGGLISGIGSVLKSFQPNAEIIGVSATNTAALAASMKAGEVVQTEHLDTLADGVSGGVEKGSVTVPLAIDVVDRVVHCSEEKIAEALRELAWRENMVVEGAAALALAGFNSIREDCTGKINVILLCGANYDIPKIIKTLTQP